MRLSRPADSSIPSAMNSNSSDNGKTEEKIETERRSASGDRRADAVDRRSGGRRGSKTPTSEFDRRRGPGRRRTDYRRAAEEGEMTEEQLAFILSMDEYKRVNNRPYPSLTEILDVILYLGYRKVADPGEHELTKARQTPKRGAPKQADHPDD